MGRYPAIIRPLDQSTPFERDAYCNADHDVLKPAVAALVLGNTRLHLCAACVADLHDSIERFHADAVKSYERRES